MLQEWSGASRDRLTLFSVSFLNGQIFARISGYRILVVWHVSYGETRSKPFFMFTSDTIREVKSLLSQVGVLNRCGLDRHGASPSGDDRASKWWLHHHRCSKWMSPIASSPSMALRCMTRTAAQYRQRRAHRVECQLCGSGQVEGGNSEPRERREQCADSQKELHGQQTFIGRMIRAIARSNGNTVCCSCLLYLCTDKGIWIPYHNEVRPIEKRSWCQILQDLQWFVFCF